MRPFTSLTTTGFQHIGSRNLLIYLTLAAALLGQSNAARASRKSFDDAAIVSDVFGHLSPSENDVGVRILLDPFYRLSVKKTVRTPAGEQWALIDSPEMRTFTSDGRETFAPSWWVKKTAALLVYRDMKPYRGCWPVRRVTSSNGDAGFTVLTNADGTGTEIVKVFDAVASRTPVRVYRSGDVYMLTDTLPREGIILLQRGPREFVVSGKPESQEVLLRDCPSGGSSRDMRSSSRQRL